MEVRDYLDRDGVFVQNEKYLIRGLREEDKEESMRLQIDVSNMPKAYRNPSFYEYAWKDRFCGRDLVLAVILKDTGRFIGTIMLKNLRDEVQEIGIDLIREYRNQGIGYETVKLALEQAKKRSGKSQYFVRIYCDNLPSIRLFRKFHAVELCHEDGEFIQAMKSMEKSLGTEYMAQQREKERELFEEAEKKYIILYRLDV